MEIARAVYDVEEATATAFDIILAHKVDENLLLMTVLFTGCCLS